MLGIFHFFDICTTELKWSIIETAVSGSLSRKWRSRFVDQRNWRHSWLNSGCCSSFQTRQTVGQINKEEGASCLVLFILTYWCLFMSLHDTSCPLRQFGLEQRDPFTERLQTKTILLLFGRLGSPVTAPCFHRSLKVTDAARSVFTLTVGTSVSVLSLWLRQTAVRFGSW